MAMLSKEKEFVDPVCGMTVKPETAAAKSCYNGIQIYFCAPGCKNAFDADPQKYTLTQRKGFWRRYLDRLNKSTGGEAAGLPLEVALKHPSNPISALNSKAQSST